MKRPDLAIYFGLISVGILIVIFAVSMHGEVSWAGGWIINAVGWVMIAAGVIPLCATTKTLHNMNDGSNQMGNNPSNSQKTSKKNIRYVYGVVACIALVFLYACIGAALGWSHGGGYIPLIILMAIMSTVWMVIVGKKAKGVYVSPDASSATIPPPLPNMESANIPQQASAGNSGATRKHYIISFQCPHCSHNVDIDESEYARVAGRVVDCPECKGGISIPPMSNNDDTEFYAEAMKEVEDPATRNPGIWARAFCEYPKDEALAKASYIKMRVKQMLEVEKAAKQAAEAIRLKRETLLNEEKGKQAESDGMIACPMCLGRISKSNITNRWNKCPHCHGFFQIKGI